MMTPRLPLAIFFALLFSGCAHILQPADLSDPGIKARAEEIIQSRKDVDVSRVSVDVIDGIVTLSGIISSPDESREITRAIKRLRGVDSVLNNLLIQD